MYFGEIFMNYPIEIRRQAYDEIVNQYGDKDAPAWGRQIALARELGLSPAAITKWKQIGVASSRIPYFMLRFPHLQVWKLVKKSN